MVSLRRSAIRGRASLHCRLRRRRLANVTGLSRVDDARLTRGAMLAIAFTTGRLQTTLRADDKRARTATPTYGNLVARCNRRSQHSRLTPCPTMLRLLPVLRGAIVPQDCRKDVNRR